MSSYNIKVNLLKLPKAAVMNITGKTATKKCIVIPIEDADLHEGEKGVYLNLAAFEIKEPKYSQTHLVKASLDKETREAMSEEQRNAQPILGGMEPIKGSVEAQANVDVSNTADDLPF